MILLLPFALITLLITWGRGPNRIDSVRLESGHRYVLTVELMGWDPVFGMYESTGPAGLYWRHVSYLSGLAHNDPLTGDPQLLLSPDSNWLLVRRAGLWTDCFRLERHRPVPCDASIVARGGGLSEAAFVRLRSRRIAVLTGIAP